MSGSASGRSSHWNPTGWLLVGAQAALLAAIVLLPGPADAAGPVLRAVGLGLEVSGLVIVLAGAAQLGASLNVLPTTNKGGVLRTGGLYRIARHPIYLGVLMFSLGAVLRAPTLARAVAAVALAVLLRGKAAWEERRLADSYPGYADYSATVPAILPLPRPRRSQR